MPSPMVTVQLRQSELAFNLLVSPGCLAHMRMHLVGGPPAPNSPGFSHTEHLVLLVSSLLRYARICTSVQVIFVACYRTAARQPSDSGVPRCHTRDSAATCESDCEASCTLQVDPVVITAKEGQWEEGHQHKRARIQSTASLGWLSHCRLSLLNVD